jgi:hypothetical protein
VLIDQHYLNNNGCFTHTSGIISGALHNFVLSAAIELQDL